MHYGELKKCDIANGEGVRVSLFVSGCRNHCKDCFQPETWDFCYGRPFTEETEQEIYAELDKPYVGGLSLLGGDPFEPENQRALLPMLRRIREKYPKKNIWCYTGYQLEELLTPGAHPHCEATEEMLSCIDILIDGRFMPEEKDISLQFRGSRNQRVIDMNRTRQSGKITPCNNEHHTNSTPLYHNSLCFIFLMSDAMIGKSLLFHFFLVIDITPVQHHRFLHGFLDNCPGW